MSSILDALRELEGGTRGPAPASGEPPEPPSAVDRVAETLGIVAAGFVVGGIAFALFVWLLGRIGGGEVGRTPSSPARPPRTSWRR